MAPETRNLIAAMSLSLAILLGWQLYVVEPDLKADRAAYEAQQQVPQSQTTTAGQRLQADLGVGQAAKDTVAQDIGTRITIETPQLTGSFSTMGGSLDDVVLRGYFETQDEQESQIHLFKRFDSEHPYLAGFGWLSGDCIQSRSRPFEKNFGFAEEVISAPGPSSFSTSSRTSAISLTNVVFHRFSSASMVKK